jgi:hypothetical protein
MNPLSRFFLRRHYRHIGSLGGQARARQQREPIRERTRWLRERIGLPESEALL